MSLSAQGAGHQNLETASAIRTETVTGSHIFKVFNYSLTKGTIGIGNYIDSDVFVVDGYEWLIRYYPDGYCWEDRAFISFQLITLSVIDYVKAKFSLTILEQNGAPSDISWESELRTSPVCPNLKSKPLGSDLRHLKKRSEFEECLEDDAITLKCTVTIVKGTYRVQLQGTNPYEVVVPRSNLTEHLISLLESGEGADVTFVVNGNSFKAHRWMLAARSVVFKAELFGGMKEKLADNITVDDIEAPAFKAMLHFIYSDSLPEFEGKQDLKLMAQHLLVAADRYALERLRLMCEDVLCKNLDVSNAATSLFLAERHNCSQLKEHCLSFMSNPGVFKEVALTPGFQNIMKIGP